MAVGRYPSGTIPPQTLRVLLLRWPGGACCMRCCRWTTTSRVRAGGRVRSLAEPSNTGGVWGSSSTPSLRHDSKPHQSLLGLPRFPRNTLRRASAPPVWWKNLADPPQLRAACASPACHTSGRSGCAAVCSTRWRRIWHKSMPSCPPPATAPGPRWSARYGRSRVADALDVAEHSCVDTVPRSHR